MDRPNPRPIKHLLIANRGEIATRIISAASELDIETYAIFVSGDSSHTTNANHTIELKSSASFMSIDTLLKIVKDKGIDAVHPGYGFLSESCEFSKRMWEEASALVVGPGWGILERTGDKLNAKLLAEDCQVPTCPAIRTPTSDVGVIEQFAADHGFPVIVKAVDGGGGRGIRLVRNTESLCAATKRAIDESPSKQVFVEKAAVEGFKHVEVQIIGDGSGKVTHLWERDCSIQRRYQKVVEIAPSQKSDRKLISRIIEDALRMAQKIRYFSLGTFEFLVNPVSKVYFFLEINPRLQVEHTITEAITMTDIIRVQLLLAQGADLTCSGLPQGHRNPATPPAAYSIQLRIMAENVRNNWSLSIGKVSSFRFPIGNGIRVDTHLVTGTPAVVSADFDSLIAKIIVTASSWDATIAKAKRALDDTRVNGIITNLNILRGIVSHHDFREGNCNTQWLEHRQEELVRMGEDEDDLRRTSVLEQSLHRPPTGSSANSLFRKGDAWTVKLDRQGKNASQARPYHVEIARVLRNEFPKTFSAEIVLTEPSTSSATRGQPESLSLTFNSTSSSASTATSSHKRGDRTDPSHILIPFPGKLVEVLVDEEDRIREGDVVCVIQQMKMELEVRCPRSGRVTWLLEVEDGEEVEEGMLAAIIEIDKATRL